MSAQIVRGPLVILAPIGIVVDGALGSRIHLDSKSNVDQPNGDPCRVPGEAAGGA